MTVYVDQVRWYPTEEIEPAARRFGNRWSHLTATTEAELRAFAVRLLGQWGAMQWIQKKNSPSVHYDLNPPTRQRAIVLGALELLPYECPACRKVYGVVGTGRPTCTVPPCNRRRLVPQQRSS